MGNCGLAVVVHNRFHVTTLAYKVKRRIRLHVNNPTRAGCRRHGPNRDKQQRYHLDQYQKFLVHFLSPYRAKKFWIHPRCCRRINQSTPPPCTTAVNKTSTSQKKASNEAKTANFPLELALTSAYTVHRSSKPL
jgi:hypothetical protein